MTLLLHVFWLAVLLLLAASVTVTAFQSSVRAVETEFLPNRHVWSTRMASSSYFSSLSDPSVLDQSPQEQPLQQILVFDNVFSASVCQDLHRWAVDYQQRIRVKADDDDDDDNYRDARLFLRPPLSNPQDLTPLELALDSYLASIDDPSCVVEYWTRQRFANLDLHADLDEKLFDTQGTRRCPTWGHVLYLDVATTTNNHSDNTVLLRGPTCVVPNQKVGWGLQHPTNNVKNNQSNEPPEFDDLITVPAVPGRVLRFPGSAMHGVPYPAHRWLLSDLQEKELQAIEQEMETYEQYTTTNDNNILEDHGDRQRSVVLFNAWPGDEPLPKDVPFDTTYIPKKRTERSSNNDDDDAAAAASEALHCNPRIQWQSVPIQQSNRQNAVDNDNDNDNAYDSIRINLMGKQARRFHPFSKVQRTVSTPALFEALTEETNVTRIPLFHPPPNKNRVVAQLERFVVRLLSGPR